MIGIEFTTFSLIGRCERTGMFGMANYNGTPPAHA